jgi:hypothetical protein
MGRVICGKTSMLGFIDSLYDGKVTISIPSHRVKKKKKKIYPTDPRDPFRIVEIGHLDCSERYEKILKKCLRKIKNCSVGRAIKLRDVLENSVIPYTIRTNDTFTVADLHVSKEDPTYPITGLGVAKRMLCDPVNVHIGCNISMSRAIVDLINNIGK